MKATGFKELIQKLMTIIQIYLKLLPNLYPSYVEKLVLHYSDHHIFHNKSKAMYILAQYTSIPDSLPIKLKSRTYLELICAKYGYDTWRDESNILILIKLGLDCCKVNLRDGVNESTLSEYQTNGYFDIHKWFPMRYKEESGYDYGNRGLDTSLVE
jgi:hypothetical protein